MITRVCLVQPPFTQLNGPYPSVYYLRAFLERRGCAVTVRDDSIGLFETIFCRAGLERIFADAKKTVTGNPGPIVGRFLSEERLWLHSIDRIIAFLRGADHEWGHCIALANGLLPGGPRYDARLAGIRAAARDAAMEDAPLLASALLADIADFITVTLDRGFSLIRYASSAAGASAGFRDFSTVQAGLNGYIMNRFYRPLLEAAWQKLDGDSPLLLGVTIPFPGCLAGALVCAESAKARFGGAVITVAGGGYVNTELRFITEKKWFDYFDYLSLDRGYGALDAIINHRPAAKIIMSADAVDDDAARTVFPDYSGVDFSRYIRPVDDANPMHRLWSDGRWLKAYTAHGCYWHNCAFCDTGLDYIRRYLPVDVDALFRHLTAQAEKTGARGVHLVDEACPPAALLRLALLNREAGLPLVFWGNIRFEQTFTPDAAAVLAAGGLIGVSGGIEVASERGFARIGKGIDLRGAAGVCAAFKEAGILVHAYLIYGYWDEDDQELIDSAEIMRQFFQAGLLDSAFWHQFVLTKHSRVYAEYLAGQHPGLRPCGDPLAAGDGGQGAAIFAVNDLSFAGGERFDRYAAPLDRLLGLWMNGDTAAPVGDAFPFRVPRPSVPPDRAAGLLDEYARMRDRQHRAAPPQAGQPRALFLGSTPGIRLTETGAELRWRWRLADCRLRLRRAEAATAEPAAALLEAASHGTGMPAARFFGELETLFGGDAQRLWTALRKQGLALLPAGGT